MHSIYPGTELALSQPRIASPCPPTVTLTHWQHPSQRVDRSHVNILAKQGLVAHHRPNLPFQPAVGRVMREVGAGLGYGSSSAVFEDYIQNHQPAHGDEAWSSSLDLKLATGLYNVIYTEHTPQVAGSSPWFPRRHTCIGWYPLYLVFNCGNLSQQPRQQNLNRCKMTF